MANNQASSFLNYDGAGNVLNDTLHSYVYDGENRIQQVNGGVSYIYDAEGRRVGKSNGTVYVVLQDGTVLDELDGGSWTRSEVLVGGKHVATVTPAGVDFLHFDWLGTERARTSPTGVLCETMSSQPFGDNAVSAVPGGSAGCSPTPDFFTGKPRDSESGLDDFGARYFSSKLGRWMSPDWSTTASAVPYATLTNPQTLNLYAYVGNDPVAGVDRDGHFQTHFGDITDNVPDWEAAVTAETDEINNNPASEGDGKQAAQQQDAQGKQVSDALKKGADIGSGINSELALTKIWHDIMQTATDNALGVPESGLGEEKVYDARVADYAQAQAMYHGTLAGLKWQDVQNGIIAEPKPVSAFAQWVNTLWNAPLLSQEKATIETTRQDMVDAHDDYVRAATAMYGSQQ